jgi:hypothetical protein
MDYLKDIQYAALEYVHDYAEFDTDVRNAVVTDIQEVFSNAKSTPPNKFTIHKIVKYIAPTLDATPNQLYDMMIEPLALFYALKDEAMTIPHQVRECVNDLPDSGDEVLDLLFKTYTGKLCEFKPRLSGKEHILLNQLREQFDD